MKHTQTFWFSKAVGVRCVVVLLLAAVAFGRAAVSVSPAVAPPTTSVLVSGTGFSSGVNVAIYFDVTLLTSTVTDGKGAFSKSISVPSSATPGKHTVAAKASTASAHTNSNVRTLWAQLHDTPP